MTRRCQLQPSWHWEPPPPRQRSCPPVRRARPGTAKWPAWGSSLAQAARPGAGEGGAGQGTLVGGGGPGQGLSCDGVQHPRAQLPRAGGVFSSGPFLLGRPEVGRGLHPPLLAPAPRTGHERPRPLGRAPPPHAPSGSGSLPTASASEHGPSRPCLGCTHVGRRGRWQPGLCTVFPQPERPGLDPSA